MRFSRPLVFAAVWLAAVRAGAESPPAGPLSNAAAVLSLSGEQAGLRLPVELTGVVTAAESDWNGQFFVQDETAGIFVENLNLAPPAPGDIVQVRGVSHPGAFAPIVSAPQWRKLGVAPLPAARLVSIDDLNTGAEDSQRVEVTGVVRTARVVNGRLLMDLAVVGHRLQVHARLGPSVLPESLVAARVRVRGTAATHYVGVLRHLTSVAVYVPRAEDFVVLEREMTDPFSAEVVPVNSVAQYRRGRRAEQRVHVRGVVTFQNVQGEIYVQDESGGVRTVGSAGARHALGVRVEVVGFVEYEGHLPVLRDVVVRRASGPAERIEPRAVSFAEIARGEHPAELVRLRGRIVARSLQPDTRPDGTQVGILTTLTVQGNGGAFTVEYAADKEDDGLTSVPRGSLVEVDGLFASALDATGKLTALRLLLPTPRNLRVLERPSWFTAGRLLAGLGILSMILVVALAWLLTVSRKNAALRRVVRELESARHELQEAHDTLEEKVAERSAQLHGEMTARKADELQFKAVLTERTRLARDLHDTIEQTLAGIALRLSAAAKLASRDPETSATHLQLARNWLHQSQVDLRRSIWDLRSRELEQFDLAGALQRSAQHAVDGAGAALEFAVDGSAPNLPEVVEENVLRIVQEALANVARHAQARRVSVRLTYDAKALRVRIEDDGVGFTPALVPGEGHFGLMGMSERAKRISGGLVVNSAKGRGTVVVLEVPLQSALASAGPISVSS